ncbi:MAG: 4Fe-4S binding protein [candidate division Zixibacteria bacterium]|nr:4Fe-4S binding protein [candidate division Zixibacteria bacterium]
MDGDIETTVAVPYSSQTKSGRLEAPIGKYRLAVQVAFVLVCLWIGIEFHYFVRYLESGGLATWVARPPGAEAFLPISSLMSIYHFLLTGEIHPAHPAGFFILIAILVVSLLFGKSFCSWICPVGLLSESLGDWSEKLFGRKMKLPRFLDYLLRSIKYLLLAFFVYAIFFLMTAASLKSFLDSDYNLVADVKMYYFFADISSFVLWTLIVLSLLRPFKIRRNVSSCIDCAECANVCPSNIKVDKVVSVVSDECTTCLSCLDVCPVPETLELKSTPNGFNVSRKTVAIGVVAVYIIICAIGMISGNWDNNLTRDEYLNHQKYLHSYGHPTGTAEIDELNEQSNETNTADPGSQVQSDNPGR